MAQLGDKVVLFGGNNGDNVFADTWLWDNVNWSQVTRFGALGSDGSPPARTSAAMAYDPDTGQAVLFGGLTSSVTALADTWTFGLVTIPLPGRSFTFFEWTKLSLPVNPPALTNLTMDYDVLSKTVILTGEIGGARQTWSFNPGSSTQATGWTQINIPGPAPTRAGTAMSKCGSAIQCTTTGGRISCVTVASPTQMVLFGGGNSDHQHLNLDDTWNLRGTVGTFGWLGPATTGVKPPARFGHRMAYYPAANQVVMYGGSNDDPTVLDTNSHLLDDTWNVDCTGGTLPPAWTEVSAAAGNANQRSSHGLATGPNGLTVVLFGGFRELTTTDTGPTSDTFTWGKAVACVPSSGSEIVAGAEVNCLFTPAAGVSFKHWKAKGFDSETKRFATASFRAEEHGPASITARWTDPAGEHEQTLDYTVVRKER